MAEDAGQYSVVAGGRTAPLDMAEGGYACLVVRDAFLDLRGNLVGIPQGLRLRLR